MIQETHLRKLIPILVLVLLLAAVLACGQATPVVQPTEKPEPQSLRLGDRLEQKGYLLCALAVENPATRPGVFYEAEAGEKLVAVEFIVGNVSGKMISSNVLYATLVDSEGFAYGADSGVVEDSIELLDVHPGEKVRGWAGFVVPEDSTPAILKYEMGGRSTQELQVGLTKPARVLQEPESIYVPDPGLPKLGEVAEGSGYSLSVLTVEDPATRPGYFYESQLGKKLVAVEFIVGNLSGDQISSNVLYAILIDSQGFLYGAESGAVEDSIELLDVSPGEKVRGWAGFIVPEDSTSVSFRYEMGGRSAQALQVKLISE